MNKISWIEVVLCARVRFIQEDKKWSEVDFLPKDSACAESFLYWIRSNILGRDISSKAYDIWDDFHESFVKEGYPTGVAMICEKLMDILGFSEDRIVDFLWDFMSDNKELLQEVWNASLNIDSNGNYIGKADEEEEFSVGKHYSKEDYGKIVELCVETFEESYADLDSLQPLNSFPCECVEEFGEFLLNIGIVADKQQYDILCESDEIHVVSSMWYVLDRLYDAGIPNVIDILVEYADLHRDFAEASYQRGKESLEDYFENE